MNPRYGSEILISETPGLIANISENRYNVDVYHVETDWGDAER
jgi:hypothetical protein